MTDYNVWRLTDTISLAGRWFSNLEALNLSPQSIKRPMLLTYTDARKVLELNVKQGNPFQVVVRELLPDGATPGPIVGYNVWMDAAGRWTDTLRGIGLKLYTLQDVDSPIPLTYMQAKTLYQYYDSIVIDCTIREIGSDYSSQPIRDLLPSQVIDDVVEDKQPAVVAEKVVVEVVAPIINFDVYNGLIPQAPRQRIERKVRDKYTGLDINSHEMKRILGKE
jgi:hypothetical protein